MRYQELYSSRLNLIKPSRLYIEDLFLIRSNHLVNKFIRREKPKAKEDIIPFIDTIRTNIKTDKAYYWCIQEKNLKKIIGTICLWNFSKDKKTAEIGYELHPDFQNQGFMNEAINMVMEFGFNVLHFLIIEAYTHKQNISSINLLKKNSYHQKIDKLNKDNLNNVVFEIKRDTFLS